MPSATPWSMLADSRLHVGVMAGLPPDSRTDRNSEHDARAPAVHCTLVCDGEVFFTRTQAWHERHSISCNPPSR